VIDLDPLASERIALEKETNVNALEYALKWEELAKKYEAEDRRAGAAICMFRAKYYARIHADAQNAAMN